MTQANTFSPGAGISMEETPPLQPTITVTPATRRFGPNTAQLRHQTDIRVAAYCRVSTGDECQQTSYDRQKHSYTRLISEHPGWSLAGIYADNDASGTNTGRRIDFQRMIADCQTGKIDYIITKSISRFARNTVDTLNHVRMLKKLSPSVGIFFEKENVDTLDASGELLLTILSALAQDESRSISDNVRWAYSKKFQAGIAHCNLKGMMGYDKGKDGQWIINESQAGTIRLIYDLYLSGESACRIARELNARQIHTLFGKLWDAGAIMRVLRNEKYTGDCELQKTIVKDFLTHRSCKNCGEAPRYYVRNHHSPIVSREKWDRVQVMIAELAGTRRSGAPNAENSAAQRSVPVKGQTFYNLYCGEPSGENTKPCGGAFHRCVYNRPARNYSDERSLISEALRTGTDLTGEMGETYRYTFAVWRCSSRYGTKKDGRIIRSGDEACTAPILYETALEQSFMEMLYRLKRDYEADKDQNELTESFRRSRSAGNSCPEGQAESFRLFLSCILNLPERNGAGMDIVVSGSESHSSPDLLPFKRGIYTAFVDKAVVYGDVVEYRMNYGGYLKSSGNRRGLEDFLRYRRCGVNGTALIEHAWEVSSNSMQYRRYKKKR